nr:T9SS type A sorting domain-containing protein [Pedobacter sp. ASV12]
MINKQAQDAGKKEFFWELSKNNITSGMYILVLQVDNKNYSRKIIVQ